MKRGIVNGLAGLALVLTVLLLPLWTVEAQSTGTLEGEVVNGSPDGPEVGAGIAVSLYVVQDEVQVDLKETTTDEDGHFRFEGLDTDEWLEYWLEAEYLDIIYGPPEPLQFPAGETALHSTLTVHETSDDDSGVGANLIIIRVQALDSVLRVQESYYLGNESDYTYVGQAGALPEGRLSTVLIPLPENQFGIELGTPDGDEQAAEIEGGVAVTDPIQPGKGTTYLSISYHLAVPDDGLVTLERSLPYPIEAVWVLAAQPGLQLASNVLESQGTTELQEGQPEELFVGEELPANQPIVLQLLAVAGGSTSTLPEVPASSGQTAGEGVGRGNQRLLGSLGAAIVGLALLAAVVVPLAAPGRAVVRARSPKLGADPRSRRLLADLADLEDSREAGDVDQAGYERRRSELFQAIRALWE